MGAQLILKKVKLPNNAYARKSSRNPAHFSKVMLVTVTDPCNYNKIYTLEWTQVPVQLKHTWSSDKFIQSYWGPDPHLLMIPTATDAIDAAISSGMVPAASALARARSQPSRGATSWTPRITS